MTKSLYNAKITPHLSGARGHSDHGWLNTYHSFSFANWYNPEFTHFGSLRVLNEDRVKANSGFPTHPHRDFEIFSYILSGELTHRDSMLSKGKEGSQSDKFYRMRRGDVQFTTGGTGIAHSEMNEHKSDTVHFLQVWAIPWKRGLIPRYHTRHFDEEAKRSHSRECGEAWYCGRHEGFLLRRSVHRGLLFDVSGDRLFPFGWAWR